MSGGRRPTEFPDWLRLDSSDPLDATLEKIRRVEEGQQEKKKNAVIYQVKGGLHEPIMAHYRTVLRSLAKLLLLTTTTTTTTTTKRAGRRWICIILRFRLDFPLEKLEEHRRRFDAIERGYYEELKSIVMHPLELVEGTDYRWRSRDPSRCSEGGEFELKMPRFVPESVLAFGNNCKPEEAIVRLEEVWTNTALNTIEVDDMDLMSSEEFMDCLADTMVDYYPQKRFRRVVFRSCYWWDGTPSSGTLIEEWIGDVASRIGVEAETLFMVDELFGASAVPQGPGGGHWNEDFTLVEPFELRCSTIPYCFDGTPPNYSISCAAQPLYDLFSFDHVRRCLRMCKL